MKLIPRLSPSITPEGECELYATGSRASTPTATMHSIFYGRIDGEVFVVK